MIPDPVPAASREDSRCAVCGWPLAESVEKGCVRGNCSQRPLPERLYDAVRANREYGGHCFPEPPVLDSAVGAAAVPPPLASLLAQWREAATHSAHEAALADDPDGTYAARHRARAKAIHDCIFDLERAVVRARPGRRPEEEHDQEGTAKESAADRASAEQPDASPRAVSDLGPADQAAGAVEAVARAGPIPARPEDVERLRERARFYRSGCAGLEDLGRYLRIELSADAADDLIEALSLFEATEAARVALQQQVEQVKAESAKVKRYEWHTFWFTPQELVQMLSTHFARADEAETRAEVAEAEVSSLRGDLDALHGAKFSDRTYHALKARAEKAEADVAALRARVQALAGQWREKVTGENHGEEAGYVRAMDECADRLAAALAKE